MPKKDTTIPGGVEPGNKFMTGINAEEFIGSLKRAGEAVERAFAPSRLMNAAMSGKLDECADLIGRLDTVTLSEIMIAADRLGKTIQSEAARRLAEESGSENA